MPSPARWKFGPARPVWSSQFFSPARPGPRAARPVHRSGQDILTTWLKFEDKFWFQDNFKISGISGISGQLGVLGLRWNKKDPVVCKLRQTHAPDIFAMKVQKKAQFDHVPRRAAIVLHQIEGVRYVWMTVVTAEIVLQNQRSTRVIFDH